MSDHPTDRRVRRTKARLRDALAQLLRERDPTQITVTELTARADVNRGTFYCYYRDIDHMLQCLEEEALLEFTSLMDAYTASELKKGLRPILEDVFRFIQRNLDLAVLLTHAGERAAFLDRFKEVIREKVSREWSGLYQFTGGSQRDLYLSFLVGGVVGLIQIWLEDRRTESPEEMAALAERIMLHGLGPMSAR